MGFKRVVTESQRQESKSKKDTRNSHKAKSWATLSQNDKNEVIGDWLIAQGVVAA
jgi:hypothetical protein